MADIAAHGEHVELLVNNAGFGLTGKFAALDRSRQRAMIDLNVGALTELTHAVLPGMIERKSGAILNVASTAAFQPGPGMAVYFATKAYVLSFTEALHEEFRGRGIRVTALCPGPTATEFGSVAGLSDRFAKYSPPAADVVAAGLAALDKGKAIAIPGLTNKATAQSHRFFPRDWVRRIAGSLKL
jgi:short-subunit dehydrogenase